MSPQLSPSPTRQSPATWNLSSSNSPRAPGPAQIPLCLPGSGNWSNFDILPLPSFLPRASPPWLSGSALRPPQNPWTTAGVQATSPTRLRALGRQAHVLPRANPVLSAQCLMHNRCLIHIWWVSGWIPAGWSELCENKTLSEKLWFPRKWRKLTKHTQVITQRALQVSWSKDRQKHSGAHSSRYLLMHKIK